MFWFVGNEIGSLEVYVGKSSDLVFPRKVRCFELHNTENMFWLVGPSENNLFLFFRKQTTHLTLYITGKMFWFVGN